MNQYKKFLGRTDLVKNQVEREKLAEQEASDKRKRSIQQQNKQRWLKYQEQLRSELAARYFHAVQSTGGDSVFNKYSLALDGTDDYAVGSSTYSELDGQNNFAFSFWIKPSAISGYRQILTIGTAAADYRNQQVQIAISSGKIQVYVSSTSYYWRSTTILTQDVWQHILVTRKSSRPVGQKGKVYINGDDASFADNTRYWTNNTPSNSRLMIGRHNNGWASLFPGKIDEVAVYTQDMADYISEIYGGGEAVDLNALATAPSPLSYYRMGDNDGGTGTTVTDQGTSNYNLSLVSDASFEEDVPGS